DDEVMEDDSSAPPQVSDKPAYVPTFSQTNVCQTTSDFSTETITTNERVETTQYDALDLLQYVMADGPRTQQNTSAIGTFHITPYSSATASAPAKVEALQEFSERSFAVLPRFAQLPHFRSVPQQKTEKPAGEHRVSIANLLGDVIQTKRDER